MPSFRFLARKLKVYMLLTFTLVVVVLAVWGIRRHWRAVRSRYSLPSLPLEQLHLVEAFSKLRTFDRPVDLGHLPDGSNRLFVAEQTGRVFLIENSPWISEKHLALDIRERVDNTNFYTGIFGLAFHPKARSNGRVFFHYTSAVHKGPVVSEFKIDKKFGSILADSERVLLSFPQPFGNHDGGTIAFGPDGYLYVSVGHGGGGGDQYDDAQMKSSLLGKILRIDVDRQDPGLPYAIPPDNPFVGEDGAREEIWALGFRNVWKFSFQYDSGELWAADVGTHIFEEVNLVTKGGNYGWNYYEGPKLHKKPPQEGSFIQPAIAHPYGEVSSVIGGYVYHGKKFSFLRGAYIYGDWVTGKIIAAFKNGEKWEKKLIARTHNQDGWVGEDRVELSRNRHINAFGEDQDGELYIATYDGRIFTFQ